MSDTLNPTPKSIYDQFKASVAYHERKKQNHETLENNEDGFPNVLNYKISRSINLLKLQKFINWLQKDKIRDELKQEHENEYNEKLAYFSEYLQRYRGTIKEGHVALYKKIAFENYRKWLKKKEYWNEETAQTQQIAYDRKLAEKQMQKSSR